MFAIRVEKDREIESSWASRIAARTVFPHVPLHHQGSTSTAKALVVAADPPDKMGDPNFAQCRATGTIAAVWGRFFDRETLAAKIGAPTGSRTQLALRAWQTWQENCSRHLTGEFSMAVYEPQSQRLFAMRDALGIKPLYFADCGPYHLVATSIPAIQALSEHDFELCDVWLAKFLAGVSMSKHRTAFSGIVKIPPGHFLLKTHSEFSTRRYHSLDRSSPRKSRRDPAFATAYRDVLEQAIADRLDGTSSIGVEISGGIDSSTIASLVPRLANLPIGAIHGFGFVFNQKEPEAILKVSSDAGLTNNHLFTQGADPRKCQMRAIEVLGHPAEHSNSIAHLPFYELAERLGVRTLFSGFGGDEGVTNYAPNHRCDLISSRQFVALWRVTKGNPIAKSLRIAKAFYENSHEQSYAPRFLAGAQARLQSSVLRTDVADELRLEQRLLEGAQWDAPYRTVNDFTLAMLAKPFVSTRTESGSLIAASYGIEYSWPLLDPRLVQCWLAAPTIEKVSDQMGRLLHRNAIEGIVPDQIRMQRTKSMGRPLRALRQSRTHAKDSVKVAELRDRLSPRLAALVDRTRLEAAISAVERNPDERKGVRAHWRTLSALTTLDQWLAADRPSAGR